MKDKMQRDESEIKVLLKYANSIIATLREPFLVLDKKLYVISANHAFYATFSVTEKETLGRALPSLGNKQWDNPKLLQLLLEIIPEKKVVIDYEVENIFNRIGHRVMLLNARQVIIPKQVAAIISAGVTGGGEGGGEEEELVMLAIEDITERKRLQEELKESEERYRRAFETSRVGLLLVHKIEGNVLNSNDSIQNLLGYSHEELLKLKLWEIGVTTNKNDFSETLIRLEKDGAIRYEDVQVKTNRGLGVNAEVFLINKAKVLQCNIRDTTENKIMRDEIKDKMEDLERFSKFAVDRELKMEELEKKKKELEEKLKNR